jgi:hypothetical protein
MHIGIAEGSDEKYCPDKIMTLYKTPANCFLCVHTTRRDIRDWRKQRYAAVYL